MVRASQPKVIGRPIFFGQEMIRRAAMAMRDNGSRDYFVLARAALEGAIRNEADITELHETKAPASAVRRALKVAPDAIVVG